MFCVCSFEQFGEQTLLLIFCGPKGNGKTLRTERAMKAFVEGWITMSGPSSTKAGMQGALPSCKYSAALPLSAGALPDVAGNSDSSNGCNCIYDEMSCRRGFVLCLALTSCMAGR